MSLELEELQENNNELNKSNTYSQISLESQINEN